jgi:two-component system, cell cycle sensor histidine kinase and response regulator CckA
MMKERPVFESPGADQPSPGQEKKMKKTDSKSAIAKPCGWVNRFVAAVGGRAHPEPAEGEKDPQYWRERILHTILGTGLLLALFVMVPTLLMAFYEGLWGLVIGNLSAALIAAALFFGRMFSYQARARSTLVICYAIGVFVIANAGIISGGTAWLFCFAILSGVLMGLWAAGLALLVNGATLAIMGGIMLGGDVAHFATPARAVVAGLNFMFLNAVAAISVAVLVRGLQSVGQQQQETLAVLKRERADLIQVQETLKAEVVERRRAEWSLRESEERYRLLTENIDDVIWSMDMDLNYTYVSPAADRLQGWPPEAFMTMSLDQMVTPASMKKARGLLAEQLALGEATGSFNRSATFEAELYHLDGSTVWTEVTASFMVDAAGRPVGILGVTRNITERLKALQEKEDLQFKLARARKMEALGLLAGGVAHDLNNILSGVLSYPELLLMDLSADDRFRKPLETIRDSGRRAAAVVSDLITVARGVASQRDVLDLNTLVEQFMAGPELWELKQGHPLVSIHWAPAPALLYVKGSAVHLEKVLMNLLANAAEAVEARGSVQVSTRNRYLDEPLAGQGESDVGEYVVLSVVDSGPGIGSEDRERIFEPFYTRKIMGRSGTGLGLTVVWNTVRDHGGFIHLLSGDGTTTFDLYLPASREMMPDQEEIVSVDGLMGKGETILIVDDEDAQREIAAGMLTRLGYRPVAAAGGEAALAYLKDHSVDLLLLDMMMPKGINGRETYEQAVAIAPGIKAVLASGYAETEDVRAAQRLGAGKYLRKPYGLMEMARALGGELGR